MNQRILTVDDEPAMCHLIKISLESRGFEVTPSTSGLEALSQLESSRFTLVLTDGHLADMKGEDIAREAKRRYPDIPVVLVTGSPQISGGLGLFEATLLKPFQLQELTELVSAVLKR